MNFEQWIAPVAKRLQVGLYLQTVAEWLAGGFLAAGTLVLAIRVWAPHYLVPVLYGTASIGLLLLLIAWRWSQRHPYSRQEAVALMDRQLNAGGLLLSLAEKPDENWAERLPKSSDVWQASVPRLAPRRLLSWLGVPCLFFVATCLLPIRPALTALRTSTTAGRNAVEQLEELLTSVEQAQVLRPEEQSKLREEVEKLKEEAQQAPLTHEKWELIDSLVQKLKSGIEESSVLSTQAQSTLGALMSGRKLSDGDEEGLEDELVDTLQKLSDKKEKEDQQSSKAGDAGGFGKTAEELKQLRKSSGSAASQKAREELLNNLREHLKQEKDKLKTLRKKCSKCQGGGEDGQEGDSDGEGDQGNDGDGQPGSGGVSRGRGDADLKFGKEAEEQGIKFREVALPESDGEDPQDETIGQTFSAPEVDPSLPGARDKSRATGSGVGAESWNRKLRPRHRSVIQKYFE